eukprot:scaffold187676_cov26-Tisochrysis_lutea.AAC.2
MLNMRNDRRGRRGKRRAVAALAAGRPAHPALIAASPPRLLRYSEREVPLPISFRAADTFQSARRAPIGTGNARCGLRRRRP